MMRGRQPLRAAVLAVAVSFMMSAQTVGGAGSAGNTPGIPNLGWTRDCTCQRHGRGSGMVCDEGHLGPGCRRHNLPVEFSPAYIASGLWGVRVPPNALARPGSCGEDCRDSFKLWHMEEPTTSALVGGYVEKEISMSSGGGDGRTGMAEVPYPFETEVLVTVTDKRYSWADPKIYSFQSSVQGPDRKDGPSRVESISQHLDMSSGEVTTNLRFFAKDRKWIVHLQAVQLVSQSTPSLGLQQLTVVKRIPKDLNVTLLPKITTAGLSGVPYCDEMTETPAGVFGEGKPYTVAMRSNTGQTMAVAVKTKCSNGDESEGSLMAAPCSSIPDGSQFTMTSYIGVVGDTSHPEVVAGALRTAHYGAARTAERLRNLNRETWDDRWQARIIVDGAKKEEQEALDAGLFYMLSSTHTSSRNGVSADGYSSLEYGGRMLWDVDFWMVPALALLSAPAAGAVTEFRARTLDMAKRNAGLYGYKGAQYPWEAASSDGHDASVTPTGESDQHVTLDVALGVLATARALNDTDYNMETAFPVVREVATWLCSRGEWSSRGFELLHMDGPSNTNFFNMAALLVLQGALQLAELMPAGFVDAKKVKLWRRTYSGMVLTITAENVIKPFDEAPNQYLAATEDNWAIGAVQNLLAHGIPDRISDTVLRTTLIIEEKIRQKFARDPDSMTVPCSGNSEWSICAAHVATTAYIGDRAAAAEFMQMFTKRYMLPPFYTTTEFDKQKQKYGHYMTNWGATLSTVMLSMTGLELGDLRSDVMTWNKRRAALPIGWKNIRMAVWLGGERYEVTAAHGEFARIQKLYTDQDIAMAVRDM